MTEPRRNRAIARALYVNAALLGAVLLVLVSRSESPGLLPVAAAQQAPIAGGAGVFVVPAQFTERTWGCYLMDVDAQTLCAYQFFPGEKELRLVAARDFRHDRYLSNFNTLPAPLEVRELVEKEREAARVRELPTTLPSSVR